MTVGCLSEFHVVSIILVMIVIAILMNNIIMNTLFY